MKTKITTTLTVLGLAVSLAACTGTQIRGGTNSLAGGAAAGATTAGANSELERCSKPFGTIAVIEDRDSDWYRHLSGEYRLSSTVPVLRLLIQQSNCFVVVDRGRAMNVMQGERELARSGELRAGSNFGRGQMVSADYALTPEVLFSARDTGGVGGALGGFGATAGLIGAVIGGIKKNEAAAMLTLVDNRSGVQVGVAEGSASNTDFSLGGMLGGQRAAGGLGGYSNTPQGKVIAGAFMDSYNQLVRATRNYTGQGMEDRDLGTGGRLGVDGATQQQGYRSGGRMSLRDAQQRLNDLGFEAGAADGRMGARTRQALIDFQNERGIQATGRLDAATQAELGR